MSDHTDEFNKWLVNIDVESWFKRMMEYALLVETQGSDKVELPECFMEEYFIDNVLGQEIDADRLYDEMRERELLEDETLNELHAQQLVEPVTITNFCDGSEEKRNEFALNEELKNEYNTKMD